MGLWKVNDKTVELRVD